MSAASASPNANRSAFSCKRSSPAAYAARLSSSCAWLAYTWGSVRHAPSAERRSDGKRPQAAANSFRAVSSWSISASKLARAVHAVARCGARSMARFIAPGPGSSASRASSAAVSIITVPPVMLEPHQPVVARAPRDGDAGFHGVRHEEALGLKRMHADRVTARKERQGLDHQRELETIVAERPGLVSTPVRGRDE